MLFVPEDDKEVPGFGSVGGEVEKRGSMLVEVVEWQKLEGRDGETAHEKVLRESNKISKRYEVLMSCGR